MRIPDHAAARAEGASARAAPSCPRPHAPPRGRPVCALLILGILAISAILGETALILWEQRERTVARVEREIAALNRSLAEQTARAMQSTDLVLDGARERLLRDRRAAYLMDEKAVHTVLRARIDGMPQVQALSVVDADGRIAITSRAYPSPYVYIGDHEPFLFHREADRDVLHIGKPVRGRMDGKWLLPVSRRIPAIDGDFGGLILAAIDPNYFEVLYKALDLGPGRTVSLFLRDGTLVASTAGADEAPGTSHADSPLFRALVRPASVMAGSGLLRSEGPEPCLIAWGEVRGYPLVISVAVSEDAALAEWRTDAGVVGWGASGVILILALITLTLARQLARGEALGRALRKSETRLNGIIDSAMDAILATDKDRRIVLLNRAAEQMFRCTAAEALGTPLDRFLSGELPLRPQAAALSASMPVHGPVRTDSPDIVGTRPDGETFPIEVSASALDSEEGALLTLFVRDLTARKEAEDALRKFSRAIDQTASTIVITDANGVIEYANPRFVQTTGYAVAEAIGRHPSLLKSGETPREIYVKLWDTISCGGVWHGEFHNRRKDGTLYWESAIISPVRSPQGEITHYVAIKDDITERKQAVDELHESHRQLREMAATLNSLREEEMVRIARELHDELGQKLTGLKMDLSWLEGRLGPDRGALHDKVGSMKKLIDATVKSVRRISTGLRPLVLDDLGPIAALEWLADDFSRRSAIDVVLDLGMEELDVDDRTATALFRIVQESLTNVARHAGATRVEVSLNFEGERLVLKIADDGKGMPAEALSRKGGFGLVGIRERAFMCGGEFRVSGGPHGGTTVEVDIPLPEGELKERHA